MNTKAILIGLLLVSVAIVAVPTVSANCVPGLDRDFCAGGGAVPRVPECWTTPDFTLHCEWE